MPVSVGDPANSDRFRDVARRDSKRSANARIERTDVQIVEALRTPQQQRSSRAPGYTRAVHKKRYEGGRCVPADGANLA